MGNENWRCSWSERPAQSLLTLSLGFPKILQEAEGSHWRGRGGGQRGQKCVCLQMYVCVCLVDVYEREGFIFSPRIIFSASAYRLRIKNNNTLLPSTRWQFKLLSYEYNKIITFTFKTSKYQINTEIWHWCLKSSIYDNKPCTVYIYVKLELLIVQYITQEDTSLSEYTQQSYKEAVWDKTDVGNSIKAWIIVSCSIKGPWEEQYCGPCAKCSQIFLGF